MSPEMIKTIQDYFKTQPVLKAWVFGSYPRTAMWTYWWIWTIPNR